jgi:hypothetical protein
VATEYVVFSQHRETETLPPVWVELDRRRAHNPRQAIQAYLLDHLDESRAPAYCAVPTRNWKPELIRVESKPRVLFDGGKTLAEADAE